MMNAARILSCKFSLLALFLLLCGSFISGNNDVIEDIFGRHQFPDGFLFGVSTSSYQIEGAILEDGKSLSNWDTFVHKKGTIPNGDTGDVADDHYHRYLEDIEIIHSLGVDAYRFSISWSRILPRGKFGDVNPAGIAFYNKLIDHILLRGIRPFVTIHHCDHPQELQDRYGAWLSPLMQDDYVYFAKTCFKNFGDRVKYWITINEPSIYSEMAYMTGAYSPGRCSPPFGNCYAGNSDIEPLIAMHNMLLAHAKAANLYHQHFQLKQGGFVGINVYTLMVEPMSDDEHDREAANRAIAFFVGWTCDPLIYGDYPPEMRRYHGSELPEFTREERNLVTNNTLDFIGMSHYTTLYAKDCLHSSCENWTNCASCNLGSDRAIRGFVQTLGQRDDGVLIGEPTGMPRFFVVPRGLEEIVNYFKNKYQNKPMFITENGYSYPGQERGDLQYDTKRVEYHKAYLASLARAIRNGADVRGYFVWSLMDNFEWAHGYSVKFGLHSIDPLTLKRLPRYSAKWYRDFLKNNTQHRGTAAL